MCPQKQMIKGRLIITLALAVLSVTTVFAEDHSLRSVSDGDSVTNGYYHDSEGHFSFAIPDGWVKYSKDKLAQAEEKMYIVAIAADKSKAIRRHLSAGFYDEKNLDLYMLMEIRNDGRLSENNFQKLIPAHETIKKTQDIEKGYNKFINIKIGELTYDNEKHALFVKSEMLVDAKRAVAIAALICSKNGSVNLVFYTPEEYLYRESGTFKKIIDSFNFEEGYRYSDGEKEKSKK